jgi:hypothetical protein
LGARSVPKLREFYRAIGSSENEGSDGTLTSFTIGTLRLALYPVELLGAEAAPNAPVFAAGASLIGGPTEREWGGCSGYFSDPEGNHREVAWAPWLTEFE